VTTFRRCTEAANCRSCSQLILWVEWASGKKMPIDISPNPNGNIVVTYRKSENKLLAENFDRSRHEGRRRFVSHFTTCPQASQHRRNR
jgi:hypothetical protein